ncbi:hypothetical protein [Acetobacterium tundrae]|uniref:Uncharacterized protein n=1 Tax=Acetobacterium tundrae TaxID=132932 RepID=A0ABR6WJA1_9FIRM|nr:hypothetical protein [Acetobacterium tundrae]MBC3796378.1 hypothetical protein [Acetobacterium tundrae]
MKKENLNKQHAHWEDTFSNKPQMFGTDPSEAAIMTVEVLKKNGAN